jgi:thiopurine S-methyltransferase
VSKDKEVPEKSELEYWSGTWNAHAKPPWKGERSDEDFKLFLDGFSLPQPGAKVLVPLCGDSEVMLWLHKAGWAVVGVEFVREAAERFFASFFPEEKIEELSVGAATCLSVGSISIFVQDFFSCSVDGFDLIYDRAALVAIPPSERQKYAQKLTGLLNHSGCLYIETVNTDEQTVLNAPFPVAPESISSLFHGLQLREQITREVFEAVGNMLARGATRVWKTRSVFER